MATYSDNFNRSDGGLGSNWTTGRQGSADLTISSNRVVGPGNDEAAWAYYTASEMDSADYYASVYVESESRRLRIRGSTSAETFYEGYYAGGWSNESRLEKIISGSRTVLDTWTPGVSSAAFPTTIKITADGSDISFAVDGTVRMEAEDSAITAVGYPGITGRRYTNHYFDDFLAQDLEAAAVSISPSILSRQGNAFHHMMIR